MSGLNRRRSAPLGGPPAHRSWRAAALGFSLSLAATTALALGLASL